MADALPDDLVVLYQDAFTHFDTDNDGIITTKQLGPLLRFCGENPSEAEIQVHFSLHVLSILRSVEIVGGSGR